MIVYICFKLLLVVSWINIGRCTTIWTKHTTKQNNISTEVGLYWSILYDLLLCSHFYLLSKNIFEVTVIKLQNVRKIFFFIISIQNIREENDTK